MAKVFCLDQHNNYVESMSKEEIIAAIQTAAQGGSLEGFSDAAFVTKIKERNKGGEFSVWLGTQAEYNKLAEKQSNVLYIISDDPLAKDMPNKIEAFAEILQAQNTAIMEHDNKISRNVSAVAKCVEDIAKCGESLEQCDETLKANGEMLKEHAKQLQRVTNVGFTTLFDTYTENYTASTGIALSDSFLNYDFLIIEMEEITESGERWRARTIVPTFNLIGMTRHGLYFTFLQTTLRTTMIVDTGATSIIKFYKSEGTSAALVGVYGYNKKGGV